MRDNLFDFKKVEKNHSSSFSQYLQMNNTHISLAYTMENNKFDIVTYIIDTTFHVASLRLLIIVNNMLGTLSAKKSVISVPIEYCIHHHPKAWFYNIPRVGTHFYDIHGLARIIL